jgi:hypothetical protein
MFCGFRKTLGLVLLTAGIVMISIFLIPNVGWIIAFAICLIIVGALWLFE